jgi:uncharacterized protein
MPNVVVSAALKPNSVPERAVQVARLHDTICLSPAVLEEIRAVLSRPRFRQAISYERREQILLLLSAAARVVEPAVAVHDCRDAKDNKYLEAALAAGAEIIITGDPDLLELDPWRGIRILRPSDYIALAEARIAAASRNAT